MHAFFLLNKSKQIAYFSCISRFSGRSPSQVCLRRGFRGRLQRLHSDRRVLFARFSRQILAGTSASDPRTTSLEKIHVKFERPTTLLLSVAAVELNHCFIAGLCLIFFCCSGTLYLATTKATAEGVPDFSLPCVSHQPD